MDTEVSTEDRVNVEDEARIELLDALSRAEASERVANLVVPTATLVGAVLAGIASGPFAAMLLGAAAAGAITSKIFAAREHRTVEHLRFYLNRIQHPATSGVKDASRPSFSQTA